MFHAHADTKISDDEGAFCLQAGGAVEKMPMIFSTAQGDVTGFTKPFCTFHVDNGFISIGLETFSSDKPNIAATYMKQLTEITEDSPLFKGHSQNPGNNVCLNLGGTTLGSLANGGFTNALGQSDICVFADGSMVSAWSLIYMANHRAGFDAIKNSVHAAPLPINMP
jgi:hypothetical protein